MNRAFKRWISIISRVFLQDSLLFFHWKQNGFRQSWPRWPGSFLDSPTMRNVLSGLCFNDHATDAQEPFCLARTHHRAGGVGGSGRQGGRQTLNPCVCVSLAVVRNITHIPGIKRMTGAASLALISLVIFC